MNEQELRINAALAAGYELSTWAACINWRGGENQAEWLDELREKIAVFQSLFEAVTESEVQ